MELYGCSQCVFDEETYEEFEERYTGFLSDFYLQLKQELPESFLKLTFHKKRREDSMTFYESDSFACYENGSKSFVIQIDPECESIIVIGHNLHHEWGRFWSKDPYTDALQSIRIILNQ